MKASLREKKLLRGRLAEELIDSEGYQLAKKELAVKRESLLKEVLTEKTIEDVRHRAGMIDGLDYLGNLLERWIREAKSANKN